MTIFPAKAENSESDFAASSLFTKRYNPKITSYGTEIKAKSETPSIKTKSENAKCHYLHPKLNQVMFVSSTTTTTTKNAPKSYFSSKSIWEKCFQTHTDTRQTCVSSDNTCGFSCWTGLFYSFILKLTARLSNNMLTDL